MFLEVIRCVRGCMEQGSAIFLIAHARRLHHAVSKHKVILINGDSYLLIGRLTLRL